MGDWIFAFKPRVISINKNREIKIDAYLTETHRVAKEFSIVFLNHSSDHNEQELRSHSADETQPMMKIPTRASSAIQTRPRYYIIPTDSQA